MGMDLKPCRPSKKAPLNNMGHAEWGRYNWWGWEQLWNFLNAHGVDTSEFDGMNDGKRICAATCKQVAKTIRENIDEYTAIWPSSTKEESEHDALLWETCGGYRQY